MDIIEKARELGMVIQADERYIAFARAKDANDADEALQSAIGEFNLIRMQLNEEVAKDEGKDEEKIKLLNTKLRKCYSDIMVSDSMQAYNEAKEAFDAVVKRMYSIIEMSINGEDPETCEPSGCTGSCSTCGGCH